MEIIEELKKLSDKEYKEFSSKLLPNIDCNTILGVRVPLIRDFAKKIKDTVEAKEFLTELPHCFYEENMLHGVLISNIKDYKTSVYELNRFLPYVDNWAVCDSTKPNIFKKHKEELLKEITKWINSKKTYTVRFGIEMLMNFYLDDDFSPKYNDMVKNVKSEEYYVNMMISWYLATALTKQWTSTIKIIEEKTLDKWVHNKTIQKAIESYRITDEQKDYLRKLRV